MPSSNYAYVNGRFVSESEATVSIFDRGFLYGDGCFETMRVYSRRVFRAADHLRRLGIGLNWLGIDMVLSPEELRAACRALIQYNDVTNGVARVYHTQESVVVTVHSCEFQPRELRAIVSSVRVDMQLSGFKTANRLPYILAEREARNEGVDDAALLNATGHVVEFTTSNVFVVRDKELFTPPLSDGPLPGITREAILSLAGEGQIPVHERSFGREFLYTADEVFATNSLMEISPVVTWGHGRSITSRLQAGYRELVTRELSTPEP